MPLKSTTRHCSSFCSLLQVPAFSLCDDLSVFLFLPLCVFPSLPLGKCTKRKNKCQSPKKSACGTHQQPLANIRHWLGSTRAGLWPSQKISIEEGPFRVLYVYHSLPEEIKLYLPACHMLVLQGNNTRSPFRNIGTK